ncbi:Xaa-Pro aminopeptidase [Sphaerotilus sulfidivorans]|uniref:Aminopeptidase P family protein n=1 Tax=Sphaerotilus sulfidivorans TaxID=639200 RepID=A0A5C1Q0U8_9BURK|nr:aminopeptidase P family protein [Sphaerotilus sulfidivorans]NZD45800.1 aminopeptidase P family protein [Sphaerotilus sulfidivorans]QEN01121.1 aminopeptidase P family protein [Sphaerotilus sulfidivorans]
MTHSPSPIPDRLAALRQALVRHDLAAVLVPSSDPHLSEYLPERWQGRVHFSGFTGSMGTLVVTRDRAAVFADSRYWTQAEAELAGTTVELVKIPTGAATHPIDWLTATLSPSQTLAVDAAVLGLAAAQMLAGALQRHGIGLRTDLDLMAEAWPERPGLPAAPVREHLAPHAAVPRAERLAAVRAGLARHRASHHLVSTVDDIAWITSLRGADVDYNPVFLAHLLIGPQRATLFVAAGKVDAALAARLAADGIDLADYAEAAPALAALPADAVLLVDPKRITLGLREAVPAVVPVVEAINPSTLAKSRKTPAEAAFIREAMEKDGAAMCRFYAWLEAALGREAISELTIDERLTAERAREDGFVSLSFPTIAGFNANGAMPHYRATPESFAEISTPDGLVAEGLLLIDSGAQYLGGTTDITRVWPIGTPSAAQKADFTRVLKGTMALSRARFPAGTLSPHLDTLARAPLWEAGLDFGHGTGHGVGYFLNVHEGPQSISRAMPDASMAMHPGMITSVEPGLYRDGRWGIRIENLVLNISVGHPDEFGEYLAFETLTLCPIDSRCLELSLLRADELQWLNDYHAEVRRRLAPRLDGAALDWLLRRTEPV